MKNVKKGRSYYCSARNCKNKQSISTESFFRFPSDVVRARIWAIACGREDLLQHLETLNKNHRLCGAHFENKMFLNDLKNRLQPNALPTIFPSLEGSSVCSDHNYSVFISNVCDYSVSPIIAEGTFEDETKLCSVEQTTGAEVTNQENKEQIHILQDIVLSSGQDQTHLSTLEVDIPKSTLTMPGELSPVLLSPTSSDAAQTPQKLSAHTPREEKLRKTVKSLQSENKQLHRKIKEYETQLEQMRADVVDNITLKQYRLLTHKFCPSRQLANFINAQVSQIPKHAKGRRYSLEFKNDA